MAPIQHTLHFRPLHTPTRRDTPHSPIPSVNDLQQTDSVSSFPFLVRSLPDRSLLAVSSSGDHAFLTAIELDLLQREPTSLPLKRQAEFRARFLLGTPNNSPGTRRLLKSRQATKRETIENGPALHIIVPTLQCEHSCQYCQVSRSLEDQGHTMSLADLSATCDSIFESPAKTLTVEFQGGDPLLRFDLLEFAIRRITTRNLTENRQVRFVVASTLHQLTAEMCAFFKEYRVYLSTSVDGPAWLHNRNRPIPGHNAYEGTLAGIELARKIISRDSVSALMTTTKASLDHPEEIVDEYVRLGFTDIFLRPLSAYGFAKRNQARMGYSVEEFGRFYQRALDRVLYWNRQGVGIREVYASIIFNKILSTFDSGYVDLQSPTGSGSSVLVYNYDGYVYPSDEARMLAETGDTSLRMGQIGEPLNELLTAPVRLDLIRGSTVQQTAGCDQCVYNQFCAPNPVDAYAQHGTIFAPVHTTEHCQRHLWLFDSLFVKLHEADESMLDLFHCWARPYTERSS